MLRERDNLFTIFLYADDAYRISNVMEMYGDSKEEAQRSIKRSDSARSSYYGSISGKKWGDAHNYDLCIKCSGGAQQTADLIIKAIESRVPGGEKACCLSSPRQ